MAAARTRRPAAAPAPASAPAALPPAFGAYRLEQLGTASCKFACSSIGTEHRFCGRPTIACETNGNRYGSWCPDHPPVVFVPWRRGGNVVRQGEGVSPR